MDGICTSSQMAFLGLCLRFALGREELLQSAFRGLR